MNEAYINIMEQEKQLQLHITKNDRKIITDFANSLSDKEYQLRCMWAIQIFESKLTMINVELQEILQREGGVRFCVRIKSAESIFLKLRRKGYTINLDNAKKKLNDIVGVRVTCIFRDDIYALVDCLKIQHDIKILKIKDYIKTPNYNGYRSLHLDVRVPVYLSDRTEHVVAEIQIRTIAMDFWASLEHDIHYKADRAKLPAGIDEEMFACAEKIAEIDRQMQDMYRRIADAEANADAAKK